MYAQGGWSAAAGEEKRELAAVVSNPSGSSTNAGGLSGPIRSGQPSAGYVLRVRLAKRSKV